MLPVSGVFAVAVFASALATVPVGAQEEHHHTHGDGGQFGAVNFPASCRADVAADVHARRRAAALVRLRGVAHCLRGGRRKADPDCGMAYWGIAMTYYHPIWAPPDADGARGRAGPRPRRPPRSAAKTERERRLHRRRSAPSTADPRHARTARARAAYRDAPWRSSSQRFPEDHEAAIFYALSLLGTAPPSNDPTYANQKKAAAILNGLLPLEPKHPGIAHYMIHSFDYPDARRPTRCRPRAPTRRSRRPRRTRSTCRRTSSRGSASGRSRSRRTSTRRTSGRQLVAKRHPGAVSFDTLHALDYLEYAYLQIGDEANARKVLDETAAAQTVRRGQLRGRLRARRRSRALDARAAGLEGRGRARARRGDAALGPVRLRARDHGVRARLGAARTGRPDDARAPLAKLTEIQAGLAKTPVPGPYDWAAQVEVACASRRGLARLRRGAQGRGAGAGARRGRARREDRQAPGDAGLDPAAARAARRHAARDGPRRRTRSSPTRRRCARRPAASTASTARAARRRPQAGGTWRRRCTERWSPSASPVRRVSSSPRPGNS